MTADADIYHAARLLIDQRGENAAAFAAGRADALSTRAISTAR
jgi:hypothetical protein